MKRIGYVVLAEVVLAGLLVSLAGAQSQPLGDYARSVRKSEKPASAKKYDNDNLPTSDKISVVGNATESAAPEDANAGSTSGENPAQPQDGTAPATPGAQDASKPADSSDAQKANDEWKQKIAQQQNQVDLLARELDVTQREYRLRAAAFYADAGNRLRNQGSRPSGSRPADGEAMAEVSPRPRTPSRKADSGAPANEHIRLTGGFPEPRSEPVTLLPQLCRYPCLACLFLQIVQSLLGIIEGFLFLGDVLLVLRVFLVP